MQKIASCNVNSWHRKIRFGVLLACACLPVFCMAAETSLRGELLTGYYTRNGNNGSSAQAAGNNIYIRFFGDRWLGMLFLPYPYAKQVQDATIPVVFDTARAQTDSNAYLRGTFGVLQQKATVHIERYGYLEDRLLFECGSLAPCTIRMGEGYLELIKPGVINEHIVRYQHVAID
jgi:hypothetical protein